jgi:hypothetical protein
VGATLFSLPPPPPVTGRTRTGSFVKMSHPHAGPTPEETRRRPLLAPVSLSFSLPLPVTPPTRAGSPSRKGSSNDRWRRHQLGRGETTSHGCLGGERASGRRTAPVPGRTSSSSSSPAVSDPSSSSKRATPPLFPHQLLRPSSSSRPLRPPLRRPRAPGSPPATPHRPRFAQHVRLPADLMELQSGEGGGVPRRRRGGLEERGAPRGCAGRRGIVCV